MTQAHPLNSLPMDQKKSLNEQRFLARLGRLSDLAWLRPAREVWFLDPHNLRP